MAKKKRKKKNPNSKVSKRELRATEHRKKIRETTASKNRELVEFKDMYQPISKQWTAFRAQMLTAQFGEGNPDQFRDDVRVFYALEGNLLSGAIWLSNQFVEATNVGNQASSSQKLIRYDFALLGEGLQLSLRNMRLVGNSMLENRIGRLVIESDDLECTLRAYCTEDNPDFVDLDRKRNGFIEKYPNHTQLAGEINAVSWPGTLEETLIESLHKPIAQVERLHFGIPYDFYTKVVDTVNNLASPVAFFFMREIRKVLDQKAEGKDLGLLLIENPHTVLPDPEYIDELIDAANRLNSLDKGVSSIKAMSLLRSEGENILGAVEYLELFGGGAVKTATQLLAEGTSESERLLSLLKQNPHFSEAIDILSSLKYDTNEIKDFLERFGNYNVNGDVLAVKLSSLRVHAGTIPLLVENALYVCCGEESSEMIEMLVEKTAGAKSLKKYIKFSQEGESFKQLAILQYLRRNGKARISGFLSALDKIDDDQLGVWYFDCEPQELEDRVMNPVDLMQDPKRHSLKSLTHFDLVARYNLIAEMKNFDDESLQRLDDVLGEVRGTAYESILLGNASLRLAFLERLEDGTLDGLLSDLPSGRNPYEVLASLFLPHDEPAPVSLQPAKPKYKRIVLITSLVGAETIEYIGQKTGLPVEHMTSYFAPNRIETINEGDLVLFETSHADHQRYYAAKAKVRAVNAAFMHYSGSNKDRIVHAVLNVPSRKGPYQRTSH